MGGSSKQTIGYRYYLGMHMALCHGPIDHISRIRVDDLDAWNGFAKDGTITIAKEELFGGEKREGGISGSVDVALGYDDQLQNSYLQQHLGTDIPAFRNVVSIILKKVYLGMNPYLKPWSFRVQRIYAQADGSVQWYSSTAGIVPPSSETQAFKEDFSIGLTGYALDVGTWSDFLVTDGVLRITGTAKTGEEDTRSTISKSFTSTEWDILRLQFNMESEGAGEEDLGVFHLEDGSGNIIINFTGMRDGTVDALRRAHITFLANQSGLIISDSKLALNVWYQLDLYLDRNTNGLTATLSERDSGVVIKSSVGLSLFSYAPAEKVVFRNETGHGDGGISHWDNIEVFAGEQVDLNPSHIIRECLTNADWGMGYLAADVGTSFTGAADTLLSESMGISLLWDNEVSIESFIIEIARHIDASLYVDKTTGKFELKLIRDDYDEGAIPSFDESNVERLEDVQRPVFSDLTNSVTVNYWDHKTGKTGTVTVQDTALVQMQGTIVGETIEYPGFTNPELAIKVAQRDLHAMSTPLWTGTMYTGADAKDINIGDVFKLTWADYGMVDVVMRVTEIAFGDGATNVIRIKFAQDAFAVPSVVVAVPDESGWTDIIEDPLPSDARLALEAPYYELVRQQGAVEIDAELDANPATGYLMVSAGRPASNGAINASFYADIGTGYEDSGIVDFCPYAVVSGAVGKLTTGIPISAIFDKDTIDIGSLAQIGDEIVRVDAVTDTEVTVGRAILDTIPAKHADGSYILFFDGFSASDETEYVDSEVLDVKLLTATPSAILSEDAAPVDQVTFASRAYRPFRPAGFAAGGFTDPLPTWEPTYPVLLEWDERNRLQETSEAYLAWEDGSVAEEAGTQYSVAIDAYEEDQVTLIANITTTVETGISYSLTESALGAYKGAPFIKATITSQRDGYDSYQSPILFFRSTGVGVVVFREVHDYIARWELESNTAAPDSTWRGHDGTVNGTPIAPITGQIENALTLDGIDDFISLVNHVDLRPTVLALTAWIRTTNAVGWIYQNYSLESGNAGGYSLAVNAGGLIQFLVGKSTGDVEGTDKKTAYSTSTVHDGIWRHVAVTYDGINLKIYIDEVLESTEPFTSGLAYNASPNARIGIRRDFDTDQSPFDGDMDDIRLYNRAVIQSEVSNIFASRVPAPPEDFVAEWTMDDVVSTTLNESLNNHDATLVNSPTFVSGWENEAMALDGIDQFATVVNHADLRPINVSVAGYLRTSISTSQYIIQSYQAVSQKAGWIVYTAGGLLYLTIGSNSGTVVEVDYASGVSTSAVDDDEYHHICVTYDGANIKIYVDGILEDTHAFTGGLAYQAGNAVRIGCANVAGSDIAFFEGSLDKLQVFNRAITLAEVEAMATGISGWSPIDYIGYWTMDNAHLSGATIQDQSGNSHDATMVNTPTTGQTGQVNEAILFAVANIEYATMVQHADLKPTSLTAVAWVKIDTHATSVHILSNWENSGSVLSGFNFRVGATGLGVLTVALNTGLVVEVDYENIVSETLLDDNAWHLLIASYEGTIMKLYVDGVLEVLQPFAGGSIVYSATNTPAIGARIVTDGADVQQTFDGIIDQLQLFNRELSLTEVQNIYRNDGGSFTTSAPTDYIGLWTMNDADISAPTINDTSGSADIHNATMVNTPTTGEVGQIGQAVLFESANSEYATLVDHADLKSTVFSINGWVKTSSNTETIFQSYSQNTNYAGFKLSITATGELEIIVGKNTGTVLSTDYEKATSDNVVDTGLWVHFAATYDGSRIRVYINGILEADVVWSSGLVYAATNYAVIAASNHSGTPGDYFNGHIDHLRFFDYAISAAEVDAIYRDES